MIQIQVTNIFDKTYNSNKTIIVNRGGARSSKSYSIAQLIVQKLTKERNRSILITRKTMPALKITAYKLIVDLLNEYGYYQYCNHNKTDNILIYRPTNTFILFSSLDDVERIKSTEWNYIWMEEASEFKYNDYMILKMRLSGKTDTMNHIYLSFNPISAFHWIKNKLIEVEKDVEEIVSTYIDNPFLSQEYVNMLLEIKDQDKNYWNIYGLGQWGVLENIIYSNYSITNNIPTKYDQVVYGLDFGFNHPTALVQIGELDGELYLKELLYQTKLTNSDVINKLLLLIDNKNDYIYADTAEPNRIEEIRRAGFNVRPSDKSVKDGIDFCKRKHLHISKDSVNLIKEVNGYKYKENKDGEAIEEPLKFQDDACDAFRYAIYNHWGKRIDYHIVT